MSDTDSFIDEVTEEVRRDRLFGYLKRYGWIGILGVLIIVGGASWNEWNKAQARAKAQQLGDSMLAALEAGSTEARLSALADIDTDSPGAQVLVTLSRVGELVNTGRRDDALAELQAIASNGEVDQIYRQIAGFRALTLQTDLPADERRLQFEALTQGGGIMRLLAEEQLALMDVEAGNREAALGRFSTILQDSEATSGLRRRATQLIVALGGTVPDLAGTTAGTTDN